MSYQLSYIVYIFIEPIIKKMKTSKIYGSTLIVYDKHGRCLLTEGEYEIRLQEIACNVKSKNKD